MLALAIINIGIGTVNLLIGGTFATRSSLVAVFNYLVGVMLMYGVGRIKGKMEYLENERQLRE